MVNRHVVLLLLAIALVGCVGPAPEPAAARVEGGSAVMKPDTRLRGRIRSVNDQGQYVIVDFGLGLIPPLDTRMVVYRDGQSTGVVRLTGPARGSVVAGDLVSGEAVSGDWVIVDPQDDAQEEPSE